MLNNNSSNKYLLSNQFTKDMVLEPSISTNLKLSDEDMDTIYSEIRRINILSYPENFKPENNIIRTPFYTYRINIVVDSIEKNISWADDNVSQTEKAIQMRELFKKFKK